MANATYKSFYVYDQDENGVLDAVPAAVSVILYNVTQSATPAESPLSTDANGNVAAGSLAAGNPGDRVAFRVDGRNGVSNSIIQILE